MEKETEQQIFEAAQEVFQESGFEGARMQEIADRAGINKSMLHYYFRNKEKLFQKVFERAIVSFVPKIMQILKADLSLKDKIHQLVDSYLDILTEKPHLPSFVIHEMNHHQEHLKDFLSNKTPVPIAYHNHFYQQVTEEIEAGNIRAVSPDQLLVNMIGLCVFPFIGKTMIRTILQKDEEDFQAFIDQRRKELPEFIINAIYQS